MSARAEPAEDSVGGSSVDDVSAVAAGARSRRTRRRLLAEVEREVELMSQLGLKGPASLLQGRLAARGVTATLETLRSGDCRSHLERVWVRRKASRRTFGPTRGHDMRRHGELVDHAIDLMASIERVEADLAGMAVVVAERERDPRSLAACRYHARHVAETAELIMRLVNELGAAGIDPNFRAVSEALGKAGRPLSVRSIQRRPEYWRPILEYVSVHRPVKPEYPGRTALESMTREELGALIVKLQPRLAELNARFEATLT